MKIIENHWQTLKIIEHHWNFNKQTNEIPIKALSIIAARGMPHALMAPKFQHSWTLPSQLLQQQRTYKNEWLRPCRRLPRFVFIDVHCCFNDFYGFH